MTTPTTELDHRFSDPGSAPVGWGDTLRLIESAELFWISTVRSDGSPHVTPLVAVWHDGALHVCTGPTEQKAHNLGTNPRVALTTGSNTWSGGVDVVVEGTVERVTATERLEALAAVWALKWDGRWRYRVGDGGFDTGDHSIALVFAVTPTKVLAFGKNPFTHTTHRFDQERDHAS